MTDIIKIACGTCAECEHDAESHSTNKGCTAPSDEDSNVPCGCKNIGNY